MGIDILTWKWKGKNKKSDVEYSAQHVNVLYSMIKRNLNMDFRLICVTDDPEGIRKEVLTTPLPKRWKDLGGCYVRLNAFAPNFKLGNITFDRFASVDLDVVIVDDITDIFSRKEDFLIWGDPIRYTPYWGSFFIMNKGCRKQVYNSFNPRTSIDAANYAGFKVGTDQAIISMNLWPNETMLTKDDGLLNFVMHVKEMDYFVLKHMSSEKYRVLMKGRRPVSHKDSIAINSPDGTLPENAKIVFFNGKFDPCQKKLQSKYPFIEEHWHE